MKNTIPEVDAYIAAAAPFAQPILVELRALFHRGCPDLQEEIKWRQPHFTYKGMLGGMSAFKEHVSFGFWHGGELSDPDGLFEKVGKTEMAMLKVKQLSDLPPKKKLLAMVREAATRNEAKAAAPKKAATKQKAAKKKTSRAAPKPPADLAAALAKEKRAQATFDGFSPSNQREYVGWVTKAKRAETRAKRVAQAVEWIAEGKPRNWKYMKKW